MSHPYKDLPESRYWRTAVAERSPFQIEDLWTPKFCIQESTPIITAGSCFAQHMSRTLQAKGFSWIDAEPAPTFMNDDAKRDYNYGIFSFRTGNIYTAKMLTQWLGWAAGVLEPPEEIWEKNSRFYDPFRPAIEPNGFASKEEVIAARHVTLSAIRKAFQSAKIFIFTLGLTEAWQNKETGLEYPMCPGTVAGEFDPDKHVFVNHSFHVNLKALKAAFGYAIKMNRKLQFILTVSPVPLTATASGEHVLTASHYSKSVLRAVAGQLKAMRRIDYFPSYEIITHPAFHGMFYQPNQRTVDPKGVEFVMNHFFNDQQRTFSKTTVRKGPWGAMHVKSTPLYRQNFHQVHFDDEPAEDDIRCEEEILNAFS